MAYRDLSVKFIAPNAEPVRPLPWSALVDLVLLMVCLLLIGGQVVMAAHPPVTAAALMGVATMPAEPDAVVIAVAADADTVDGYRLSVLGEPMRRTALLERLAEHESQRPIALLVDADVPAAAVAGLREQIEKASGRFAYLRLRVAAEDADAGEVSP